MAIVKRGVFLAHMEGVVGLKSHMMQSPSALMQQAAHVGTCLPIIGAIVARRQIPLSYKNGIPVLARTCRPLRTFTSLFFFGLKMCYTANTKAIFFAYEWDTFINGCVDVWTGQKGTIKMQSAFVSPWLIEFHIVHIVRLLLVQKQNM